MNVDEDFGAGLESLRPTVDAFGVPSNIHGPHPEEFFSMLGRIVALSATLESNVRTFSEHLAGLPQDALASTNFKDLVKDARGDLERLIAPDDRDLADDFLSRAEAAVLKRHVYAHSMWPAQGGGRLFGWKPNRKTSASATDMISTTLAEMREDVLRFVALCEVPYWHRILSLVSGGEHLRRGGGGG